MFAFTTVPPPPFVIVTLHHSVSLPIYPPIDTCLQRTTRFYVRKLTIRGPPYRPLGRSTPGATAQPLSRPSPPLNAELLGTSIRSRLSQLTPVPSDQSTGFPLLQMFTLNPHQLTPTAAATGGEQHAVQPPSWTPSLHTTHPIAQPSSQFSKQSPPQTSSLPCARASRWPAADLPTGPMGGAPSRHTPSMNQPASKPSQQPAAKSTAEPIRPPYT